jgi:hypothetical protein
MERTDWDAYYRQPFAATRLTRRVTQARLLAYMKRFASPGPRRPVVVELGGANSCFFDAIQAALRPRVYHVVDSNALGLDRMQARLGARPDVVYHCEDVLSLGFRCVADVVFSVGLVEHFAPDATLRAVDAHFALLRKGGTCIIAAPTPTPLYRATRAAAELLGMWKFPDERPLGRAELVGAMARHGEVVAESIVWPIFLTQRFMVTRRAGS